MNEIEYNKTLEKIECTYCFHELDQEQSEDPHMDEYKNIMCDDCYRDEYAFTCSYCEEYSYEEETPEKYKFIVTPGIAKEFKMTPGVYSVLEFPFFYGDILSGFDNFFDSTIRLERAMDAKRLKQVECGMNCEHPTTGRICLECFEFMTLPLPKVKNNHYTYLLGEKKLHRSITMRGIIAGD